MSPERVHFNQNEDTSAKYKVNIESATFDAGARKVTVKYSLTDPTNGNAAYNLVTPDCTGSPPSLCSCSELTRFGNLQLLPRLPEPGRAADRDDRVHRLQQRRKRRQPVYFYKGTNDGTNHYTVDIALPADSATAVAQGTARVVGVGQIKDAKLEVKSASDPRPEVTPRTLVNVVVQHTYADVVLSGAANPRRQVVANQKCNVCHGALGTTTGSNTKAEAFHGGARNTVEACVICHDQGRFSSSVMANGLALSENYGFKRMIHGIHGNSKRNRTVYARQ